MILEELHRLLLQEERHRRLYARLAIAAALTLVVFVVGTLLVWLTEAGLRGGDIHGIGDAAFFTAAQLLTVSSAAHNPLTSAGKVIDIGLEMWAVFVITAVAGAFSTFFRGGDVVPS